MPLRLNVQPPAWDDFSSGEDSDQEDDERPLTREELKRKTLRGGGGGTASGGGGGGGGGAGGGGPACAAGARGGGGGAAGSKPKDGKVRRGNFKFQLYLRSGVRELSSIRVESCRALARYAWHGSVCFEQCLDVSYHSTMPTFSPIFYTPSQSTLIHAPCPLRLPLAFLSHSVSLFSLSISPISICTIVIDQARTKPANARA